MDKFVAVQFRVHLVAPIEVGNKVALSLLISRPFLLMIQVLKRQGEQSQSYKWFTFSFFLFIKLDY